MSGVWIPAFAGMTGEEAFKRASSRPPAGRRVSGLGGGRMAPAGYSQPAVHAAPKLPKTPEYLKSGRPA